MRNLILCVAAPLVAQAPVGFTPLQTGRHPIASFHVSQMNHHGNTEARRLEQPRDPLAVLTVTQKLAGNGGFHRYRNYAVKGLP